MASVAGGEAATVPVTAFSTDDVPAEHRFEAWHDLMRASHDVAAPPGAFRASLRTAHLGTMLLHEITTSGQSVERTARRIRGDGLEHIVLQLNTVPMRGASGDQAVEVPAGALVVSALSRPLARQRVEDTGAIVVSLSRDLVAEAVPDPEAFHGVVLGTGMGRVLADHLRSLARDMDRVPRAAAPDLARATALVLAAALRPEPRRLAAARGAMEGAALFRARRFIEANVGSPALGPAAVAAAAGLSERTLYRLFAPYGGVAAFIRAHRLRSARAALLKGVGPARISEIARAHGFRDPAHFSHSIRGAFGLSPRELADGAAGRADDDGWKLWVRALG